MCHPAIDKGYLKAAHYAEHRAAQQDLMIAARPFRKRHRYDHQGAFSLFF